MLSKLRLNTSRKAGAAALLLLLGLSACQHSKPPPAQAPPPKIKYHETHDQELQDILKLAQGGKWEEAQVKADALHIKAPTSPMAQRVRDWVAQQREQQREQALEDKIRDIDSKSSVFSPSLMDLITEKKDRGLPASKDVRDTVQKIENAPYIPESYGKVVTEKGPLFDLESVKGKMARVLEKEVTMHVDNMPLETIIMNLSASTGVNIVADKALPALKQALSVNFDKVPLGEFLRYIGRNYDLQFQVGDALVWVVDAKDPKKLMEETRFYRLRKGFILPAEFGSEDVAKQAITVNNVTTLTESSKFRRFVNDMAPAAPSIEKAIKELFLGSKWFVDYERNIVVARGTDEQLHVMEKIIEEFDRPVQQVLIEARFVTISKPAFLQLGVLWETGRSMGTVRTPQDYTGMVGSQSIPQVGMGIQETFTNVLGSSTLTATISALEQSGESQTLSSPRLTVLNNRPATISDGKVQYYYEEYQVKSTVQERYTTSSFVPSGKPTKITSGAELNVMASISGDGRNILLALNPRVNTDVQLVKYATLSDFNADGDLQSTFDINLPQYRTQELSTRVAVRSGETVAMGGVIERSRATYVEAVPVLGSLPWIGALFRRRTEQDIPRYLLIFVTATILNDSGEMMIYDYNAKTNSAPAMQR